MTSSHKNIFHSEFDQTLLTLEEIPQRGCKAFALEQIQDLTGEGSEESNITEVAFEQWILLQRSLATYIFLWLHEFLGVHSQLINIWYVLPVFSALGQFINWFQSCMDITMLLQIKSRGTISLTDFIILSKVYQPLILCVINILWLWLLQTSCESKQITRYTQAICHDHGNLLK